MAQTIALQRGTSSVTLDGTTRYTMFTQSGGTATRVIINGCAFYSDTARSGLMGGIFVQKSGGGYFSVAIKLVGNSTTVGSMDFLPGMVNNVGGATNGTSAGITGASIFVGALATDYQSNQNMSQFALYGATSAQSGFGNASLFEYCPSQFWIGPSDVVYFKGRNNSGDPGQVSWSFTTITES